MKDGGTNGSEEGSRHDARLRVSKVRKGNMTGSGESGNWGEDNGRVANLERVGEMKWDGKEKEKGGEIDIVGKAGGGR